MIVAAAIRLSDGRVFTGPTHAQAYWAAEDAKVGEGARLSSEVGYVDADGAWVNYTAPHLARTTATQEARDDR